MRRTTSMLVVVVGVSACSRPNPLYGLPAATEGAATDGGPLLGSTTRGHSDTGRLPDGANDVDGARTEDDDGEPTTGLDSTDTGPKLDLSSDDPMSACCEPNFDGVGCEDVDLEACACDVDDFCCDVAWDQQCVDISIEDCGAVCYHEGSCCAPSTARGCADDAIEACVCEIRPKCCDEGWDITCVTIADTTCVMGCFAGDNDCCTATPDDVGCNQPDVWTCVCPEDPFCCEEFWDAFCVGGAVDCGHCMTPGTSSDCCEESPPGGCLDHVLSPGVMNCVCQIDTGCCTGSWNASCIQLGLDQCTLDCS